MPDTPASGLHMKLEMPTSNSGLQNRLNIFQNEEEKEQGFLKKGMTDIQSLWREEEKDLFPFVKVRKEKDGLIQKLKKMDFGPGGAVGVGCGVGFGVGIVGGVGVGAEPWNHLRLALGFGAGCGIGVGYGYGQGFGILWDRRPTPKPSGKRIVINI